MVLSNVSISKNRVGCEISSGKTLQFVVWDLEQSDWPKLEDQLKTAFGICGSIKEIENHLKINGFDAELEDIHHD